MHFKVFVEDQSGKKALEILIPKIIGAGDTVTIHPYKGIGRIPRDLKGKTDPKKRILLDQLPKLLQACGKTFHTSAYASYPAVVILVCDLDARCLKIFRAELLKVWSNCNPRPRTHFCIAIEEGEAWFLGDLPAVKKAYPYAKQGVLTSYKSDSICGTWQKLADAVYPGGAKKLSNQGGQMVGAEKSKWAEKIASLMDVENNNSPSFCYFRNKLKGLATKP